MAKTLQLVTSGVTTIDLLAGTFKVEAKGWKTVSDGDTVIETFNIYAQDTDSNIMLAEKNLADMGATARNYIRDPLRANAVWLQQSAGSETVKQALVYDIALELLDTGIQNPLLGANGIVGILTIRRSPFWENTNAGTLVSTGLSCWGGRKEYGLSDPNIIGTQPGRISSIKLTRNAGNVREFWIGIREAYEGKTWNAIAEMETSGQVLDADTALASDAGASPSGSSSNNTMKTTFATVATMADRLRVPFSSFATGVVYEDVAGRYLVLLRCRVDSGTTVNLRMNRGYGPVGSVGAYSQDVPVSNSSYKLVPIGEIQVPPLGYRSGMGTATIVQHLWMQIGAERSGGSGALYSDAIILIPSDHLLYMNGALLDAASEYVQFFTFEDGKQAGLQFNTAYGSMFEQAVADWVMPTGASADFGGSIVVAAQDASSHDLTATLNMTVTVYTRWVHFNN